jgi:hypothetical protein
MNRRTLLAALILAVTGLTLAAEVGAVDRPRIGWPVALQPVYG